MIEHDLYGDKVLHRPDGCFIKLFRRKRLLSSALWNPYASRFAANARRLAVLDIPCPQIVDVFRVPAIRRDAVLYRPLTGRTLRQIVVSGQDVPGLRRRLGQFLADLHRKGVLFRSLHLGNVVLTPDQRLGLIDIADLVVRGRALSAHQKKRNFQHLRRYAEDRAWLALDTAGEIEQAYQERAA